MVLLKNWELVPSERESEENSPWVTSFSARDPPSLQTS